PALRADGAREQARTASEPARCRAAAGCGGRAPPSAREETRRSLRAVRRLRPRARPFAVLVADTRADHVRGADQSIAASDRRGGGRRRRGDAGRERAFAAAVAVGTCQRRGTRRDTADAGRAEPRRAVL